MIRLLQYILESIHTAELTKELKFEEISAGEAKDIMSEKDTLARIGIDASKINNMFLIDESKHFKIMYNDTCLGIYAYCDLDKEMKHLMSNIGNEAEDRIDDQVTKATLEYYEKTYRRVNNIQKNNVLDDMRYITYLIMLPKAQQKEDIDSIATIKAFFNILKDECKKAGKKIIVANGKDAKTSKLYCKCGGFKNYADDPRNPYCIKYPRFKPGSAAYELSTSTVFYTL